MKEIRFPAIAVIASILILSTFVPIQQVQAQTVTHMLESCLNNVQFSVQGEVGTAGTLGVDYELGTYLAGGNGGLGHGFGNAYDFNSGHFITAAENGFVSTPAAGFTATGGLEDADHNWLQGTTFPVVVDLGAGNAADQAIVFNSIDHFGVSTGLCSGADQNLWNAMIEGIEFTVYGTNNLADAQAAAITAAVFNPGGDLSPNEGGIVPLVGPGSTFELGVLDYVFNDGWQDFGNVQEADDFASVWQFSQPYRFIAVFSHFTDPFVGDNFRSFDNELDAIGRFLTAVGEPCTNCPLVGGEYFTLDTTALLLAGVQTNLAWIIPLAFSAVGIGAFIFRKKF